MHQFEINVNQLQLVVNNYIIVYLSINIKIRRIKIFRSLRIDKENKSIP